MFPLKNLARKGLTDVTLAYTPDVHLFVLNDSYWKFGLCWKVESCQIHNFSVVTNQQRIDGCVRIDEHFNSISIENYGQCVKPSTCYKEVWHVSTMSGWCLDQVCAAKWWLIWSLWFLKCQHFHLLLTLYVHWRAAQFSQWWKVFNHFCYNTVMLGHFLKFPLVQFFMHEDSHLH